MRGCIPFLLLLFLGACEATSTEDDSGVPVARVGEDYLYQEDLEGIVPPGTSPTDSSLIAETFIQNWVRSRLLLSQAESSLSLQDKDVEKQLEEYRQALLIYAYEKEILNANLDTLISYQEIEEFYLENKSNFELKDYIVKVRYVKLLKDTKQKKKIKKLLDSDLDSDLSELEDICRVEAANYYLDESDWLYFDDLLKEIPIETYNKEQLLRYKKDIEFEDGTFLYLVRIRDYRLKNSISPLSLEQENIQKIILNQRKKELLREYKQKIYDEAEANNKLEYY